MNSDQLSVVLPDAPGAQELAERRIALETMEIIDAAAYAETWLYLADDYFAAGLDAAGERCVERAIHYAVTEPAELEMSK